MEKFHMFDDRIYQMTKSIKATDRIIYTVMMNTPSYAHLGQYAGISRTSVIECMKRLEKHGLIKKTNIASNQCIIKVYSLDEVPEVLTELTAKEARKAKLDSKLTESVKKLNPLSQESLPTETRNLTQSIKKLDTYNNDNNKNNIINNTKENFEEESLKKGASLCDSLGIEEAIKQSDLDDLEVSSEEAIKQDEVNSDVNGVSDQQDTPCRPESTDDELPDVDLDDEEDPEEELSREQRKAEIKERLRKAKLKNKINELDDFDDSDDDDFTFTPRKKTHIEPKKEKVKVRRVYAGGMH